jgi:hypothetical protein
MARPAGTTPSIREGEAHFRLFVGMEPVDFPALAGGLAESLAEDRKSCSFALGLLPGSVATFGRVPAFFLAIRSSSLDRHHAADS